VSSLLLAITEIHSNKTGPLTEITLWVLIGLLILALILALSSDRNMKGGAGEMDDDPSEDWKKQ